MEADTAAKKLTQRLEALWERVCETVLVHAMQVMAIKTATDIKLWSSLSSTPQTSAQLAQKTGADQNLLPRILRVLVTTALGWKRGTLNIHRDRAVHSFEAAGRYGLWTEGSVSLWTQAVGIWSKVQEARRIQDPRRHEPTTVEDCAWDARVQGQFLGDDF